MTSLRLFFKTMLLCFKKPDALSNFMFNFVLLSKHTNMVPRPTKYLFMVNCRYRNIAEKILLKFDKISDLINIYKDTGL